MEPLILKTGAEHRFFASANTAKGFVNYYEGIFSRVPRVWYIKGGPGTGKNRMMRQIADRAQQRGMTVLAYHCSSDAASLDGVMLPEIGFGILDGTAPHTGDPRYPGAGDELVNVGAFWDEAFLHSHRGEIVALTAEKQRTYRMVYACLAAEASLRRATRMAMEPILLRAKLTSAADRICKSIGTGKGYRRQDCMTASIGMGGRTHLPTLELAAKQVISMRNLFGTGEELLAALVASAARMRQPVVCSYDPLEPERLREVLFLSTGALYTLEPTARTPDKELNTARFLETAALREARGRLRALGKAEKEAGANADRLFARIRELHFALEEIYVQAMDFTKKEAFTEMLLQKVFEGQTD